MSQAKALEFRRFEDGRIEVTSPWYKRTRFAGALLDSPLTSGLHVDRDSNGTPLVVRVDVSNGTAVYHVYREEGPYPVYGGLLEEATGGVATAGHA